MVYNYPLTIFDEGTQPNPETVGFILHDVHDKKPIDKIGYGHWVKYVKSTFETLLRAQVIDIYHNSESLARTAIIDDLGVKGTDFALSNETKEKLIASGAKAARDYLSK